jgi:hypothetical protein
LSKSNQPSKDAQVAVYKSVKAIMVQTYFELGKLITEEKQSFNEQAE